MLCSGSKRRFEKFEADEDVPSSDFHDILESNTQRGGIITARLRPYAVPRPKLTQYYNKRMDDSKTQLELNGLPGWLKHFVYQHNQLGCREDRLRAVFQNLSHDLLSVIQTACISVLLLLLRRFEQAQERAQQNQLETLETGAGDSVGDEQWLYEGIGLSDDELDTFERAEFGVLR